MMTVVKPQELHHDGDMLRIIRVFCCKDKLPCKVISIFLEHTLGSHATSAGSCGGSLVVVQHGDRVVSCR